MILADAVLALLLAGFSAYVVLGGADFGGGIWDLFAGRGAAGERRRALAERSIGPVWEANHVWLIFVLVLLWTGFPAAFGAIMSTLAVPLFLAALGIVLRGSAFAFRHEVEAGRPRLALGAVFAIASVLTPFFLGAAIGGIASGRVPAGNAAGDPVTSWANPTSLLIGLLGVAAGAYLAAVYLAADASRAGEADLVESFRRRALGSGIVAGALALGGLLVVRLDSPALWEDLSGAGLPLVALSAAAGSATLGLVARRHFRLARAAAALAVAAIVWGWAVAQYPDVLPGALTIAEASAGRPTLVAVLVAAGLGAPVLAASLGLLFRLVLSGRLAQALRPAEHPGPAETRAERAPRPAAISGRASRRGEDVSRRPRLLPAGLAAFLLGAALMVFVDHPAALAAGVLLVLAFVPIGLSAIATPARLAGDPQDDLPLSRGRAHR